MNWEEYTHRYYRYNYYNEYKKWTCSFRKKIAWTDYVVWIIYSRNNRSLSRRVVTEGFNLGTSYCRLIKVCGNIRRAWPPGTPHLIHKKNTNMSFLFKLYSICLIYFLFKKTEIFPFKISLLANFNKFFVYSLKIW